MKNLFVISILFSGMLFFCGKNKLEANGKVHVRIENLAGFTIRNVSVGNANYEIVIQGQITNCKILDQPIYAGYCSFMKDSVQSGAGVGVCGTPSPPLFKPGYYTFRVTPEVNGYNNIIVIEN
ncbi:hypothetical protein FW778_15135 [Ginsengibacter hankyongi]|uniref:Uncharacterized protein n=1 Tax=Ginsengibacter hankyongi TaxID=2607284 RepID=A0A5J5IIM1_9BACT|nr:hypothetical protein [Ginsengibacter hankyongi]KAA9038089.1 hypothetical protein FW778_15135 [Ginsengibacter hankyongi]